MNNEFQVTLMQQKGSPTTFKMKYEYEILIYK